VARRIGSGRYLIQGRSRRIDAPCKLLAGAIFLVIEHQAPLTLLLDIQCCNLLPLPLPLPLPLLFHLSMCRKGRVDWRTKPSLDYSGVTLSQDLWCCGDELASDKCVEYLSCLEPLLLPLGCLLVKLPAERQHGGGRGCRTIGPLTRTGRTCANRKLFQCVEIGTEGRGRPQPEGVQLWSS
jgi:hypothetical protein